jgi:glycosyltransferase involved in cell wall biosynthesis/tetratricopeptide (TPR) repeat protein
MADVQGDREPSASGGPTPAVRILAIDTHWSSARGGISTINRELCLALAREGADVCCLILEADPEEVAAARDGGVRLIGAGLRPGWTEGELLMRRPRLPEGWQPQVIIGHGRPTGHFAEAHREDRFSGAAYFHVVHTDPDRIGGDRAETKWEAEFPQMVHADRVLAVGPALWRRAESDLRPQREASVPIRIDPGFDLVDDPARCPPPDGARKVLIAGRLEDADIKGLDLAAKAVAGAINLCAGSTRGVALLLRGVPPDQRAETEEKVRQWAGQVLDIDLRSYSKTASDLQDDLRRSVLVLMPSRAEGFGLVGLEAIVAGVPVLVSGRSGLAELLCDEAADLARDLVLPVNRNGEDAEPWSKAVATVLDRPEAAFARAAELRQRMSQKRRWADAAQRVLQAWAVSPRRIGRDPATKLAHRTALLCADGAAGRAFMTRIFPVLRDMVDHIDPAIAPDHDESAASARAASGVASSPDIVLCALGENNRGDSRPAGLTDILIEARRLHRPVFVLRVRPDATPPIDLPESRTIDVTGDFLDALAKLSGHLAGLDTDRSRAEDLAGLDNDRSRAEDEVPQSEPVRTGPAESRRPMARHRFLPINEMPAIASAGFHDRAPTVAAVLHGLVDQKYRLIVLAGQDGVGKTAVVRAIRDGQEATEAPSLRSLVYFSARGYRWISAPALLVDLAGLAEEADREPLLMKVRTAPWRAVADKVISKVGTAPIVVVIDDADRLFDNDGNWADHDLSGLITRLAETDGHPVSVLMLIRQVPAVLQTRRLRPHMLPVGLEEGLPFEYAEELWRRMDDERGTLGLAGASSAQLERLYLGTGGLPRSMELVAGLLTTNRSQTVDRVADLLDDADDGPRTLFTEIFGRLDLEERRVLQALAVFVRPVSAEAVKFLLAEVHPTLRSVASLEWLRRTRVVHSYGDRYYLPGQQADVALSTLPTEETAGPASLLTKEHLRRRGVAYFRSQRGEQSDAISDLWPQFGEIELLMRTHDWDAALTLMNEVDDVYLSRWGQSHALAAWREELKQVLERPESRGSNLSYLRAASRQYDGDTRGLEDITEALEVARSLDDRKNVIVATVQLANLLVDRGDLTEATRRYREAVDESQVYGQVGLEVRARTGLATCAAKHGDFDRAEDEMAQVARLNDEMRGSPQGDDLRASQLINQAWLRGQRGDHVTARRLLLKAQVLAERLCSDARSAWVLGGLAANALATGDNERAIRFARNGARIAQRLDNHRLLREINATQGFALLAAEDLAGAAELAETAAGYASRMTAVSAWNLTGLVAFRQDRDPKARTAFLTAARYLQTRNRQRDDYQLLDAEGLAHTGLALLDDAPPDEAVRAFGHARDLTREPGVVAHNAFLLRLFGDDADQAVLARIRVAAGISS